MKGVAIFGFIVLVIYITNVISFTRCDFESDYKCEVIHGIGVFVPPASLITVWFDND